MGNQSSVDWFYFKFDLYCGLFSNNPFYKKMVDQGDEIIGEKQYE